MPDGAPVFAAPSRPAPPCHAEPSWLSFRVVLVVMLSGERGIPAHPFFPVIPSRPMPSHSEWRARNLGGPGGAEIPRLRARNDTKRGRNDREGGAERGRQAGRNR